VNYFPEAKYAVRKAAFRNDVYIPPTVGRSTRGEHLHVLRCTAMPRRADIRLRRRSACMNDATF